MSSDTENAYNAQNPLEMIARPRGLGLDDVQEEAGNVLDFFTGVTQADVAAGNVDLTHLSRADRIALLVDGSTPSVFGSSPWSIGLQLDQSVAGQIHAQNGGTLVLSFGSTLADLAESKVRAVRYALVWDDTVIAETGTIDLNLIGTTFLVVGLQNEPTGQTLTLWITDNDLVTRIVQQGSLQDLDKIRASVIGQIGAAANTGDNPFTTVVNAVGGFFTASTVGGVVALAIVAVVLVVVVKSEAFADVAKTAAKVV